MNKQKKRAISRGKFERASHRARRGMRVNAFDSFVDGEKPKWVDSYVVDGFMYWSEVNFVDFKPSYQYFRKSISEALS